MAREKNTQWSKDKIKQIGFHFGGMYHTVILIPGSGHRQVFYDDIKIDVLPPGMEAAINQAIARHN